MARFLLPIFCIYVATVAGVSAAPSQSPSCNVGAYTQGAQLLTLTLQAPKANALRYYLFDGRSGLLEPDHAGLYKGGAGWGGAQPTVATATLGPCGSHSIKFSLKDGPSGNWTKIPLRVRDTHFSSDGNVLTGRLGEPPSNSSKTVVIPVPGCAGAAAN